MAHPRHLGGVQVGGPTSGSPAPARWVQRSSTQRDGHALHAAAQVAPGDAQQLAVGAGQSGEELVVLALDAFGPQGQLAAGAGALVVGEERVVAHGGRERALGEAEDHDEVEVEPDAHLHRADEHTVAEPAHPAEVLLELELERAVEHLEADGVLHRIEGTEAVQCVVDPLRGLALGRVVPPLPAAGAAEEAAQPALRPGGVLAPGARPGRGGGEVVDDLEHEPPELASPPGLRRARRSALHSGSSSSSSASTARSSHCSRELAEALVPVVAAGDDGGIPGEPLPRRWWGPGARGGGSVPTPARRRRPGGGSRRPGGRAAPAACGRRPGPRAGRPRRRWWRRPRPGAARGRAGRTGSGLAWSTAMRSSRVPARTASTTARTAARTSSSPSDAVSTMVRSAWTGRGVADAVPASRHRSRAGRATPRTSASAAAWPVRPAMTVVGRCAASAASSRGAVLRQPLRQVDDERAERSRGRRAGQGGGGGRGGLPRRTSRLEPGARGRVEAHDLAGPVARRRPARRARPGRGRAARGRCSRGPTRWPGARPPARTARGRRPARPAWPPPAPGWRPAACPVRPAPTRRAARPTGRW